MPGRSGLDKFSAMIIDDILAFNREFVKNRGYEKYVTSKYPDKKVAVLSCMDTRLSVMLLAATGLANGDAKVIKNAGGLVPTPFDSTMRSLLVGIYELGVEDILVIAHSDCGACHLDGHEMKELMLRRGIPQERIDTVESCGIDIAQWLEGFHDTEASVRQTVERIRSHPLVPDDVRVSGFIIDSTTGELRLVCR